MRPERVSGVGVARISAFSVSGSRAIASRPPVVEARRACAGRRRTLEQVGELRRKAASSMRAAPPTAGVRGRSSRYSIASSAPAASRKPIGCACSSARCASRPAVRARIGTALTRRAGSRGRASPRRSAARRSSERPPPRLRDRVAQAPCEATCGPLTPRCVGELENPLGARIDRTVQRVAEAGKPARRMRSPAPPLRDRVGRRASARAPVVLEDARALAGGTEDHRAGAEDAGGDRAVERLRSAASVIRRRRCSAEPVLGDRDEQQVEEEPLVRSAPRRSAADGSTR